MIFDALGVLALGEIPQAAAPTPAPAVTPQRWGGGKLVAAFTIDDGGKLRRDMDAFIERATKEDDEIMAALLMYWNHRD